MNVLQLAEQGANILEYLPFDERPKEAAAIRSLIESARRWEAVKAAFSNRNSGMFAWRLSSVGFYARIGSKEGDGPSETIEEALDALADKLIEKGRGT